MRAKTKKLLKRNLKKSSSKLSTSRPRNASSSSSSSASDFLALEREEAVKAAVLYIGHIPHGFYEDQMQAFFNQFGKIKRLRIARNRKTGKSKHYGFIEFENPEVAKVVADEINGYLLSEHMLQIHLIPPENVHPMIWRGLNRKFKPFNWREFAHKQHNKERTVEEHQRMLQGIIKRDEKRRKRIEAAGIDYECPKLVGNVQPVSKKIKFVDDDDEE